MLHAILAEVGGIDRANCKSRVRIATDYLVAEGIRNDAFIHLDVRFLEGRSPELKQVMGERMLETLREWFSGSAEEFALQITVEIQDIERTGYFKWADGARFSK